MYCELADFYQLHDLSGEKQNRRASQSRRPLRAIKDSFKVAENDLGFDHNEARSWHGWRRHVSLVMLAFILMAVIRHKTIKRRRKEDAIAAGRSGIYNPHVYAL